MPGERLFDLADLSTVWITADIYEADLPYVREGATAQISVNDIPGKTFSAKVAYLYPTLSAETRTAKVRFALPNPANRLKPQTFANIEIQSALAAGCSSRRMRSSRPARVLSSMWIGGEGTFEPRAIKLERAAENGWRS